MTGDRSQSGRRRVPPATDVHVGPGASRGRPAAAIRPHLARPRVAIAHRRERREAPAGARAAPRRRGHFRRHRGTLAPAGRRGAPRAGPGSKRWRRMACSPNGRSGRRCRSRPRRRGNVGDLAELPPPRSSGAGCASSSLPRRSLPRSTARSAPRPPIKKSFGPRQEPRRRVPSSRPPRPRGHRRAREPAERDFPRRLRRGRKHGLLGRPRLFRVARGGRPPPSLAGDKARGAPAPAGVTRSVRDEGRNRSPADEHEDRATGALSETSANTFRTTPTRRPRAIPTGC